MTDLIAHRTHKTRQRMEKLAWLLDGAIRIPGTRLKFGLDSIIGLIPVVGDVAGLLIGSAILYESLRIGAPRPLIYKMLRNSAVDALGGLIPGIGDLFDFAFKSNQRNARLLMEHLDALEARSAAKAHRSPLLALLVVTAFLAGSVGALVWVWSRLFG